MRKLAGPGCALAGLGKGAERSGSSSDERGTDRLDLHMQSLAQCGGVAIGESPFAALDPADRRGAQACAAGDILLGHSREIAQVSDRPVLLWHDDQLIKRDAELLSGARQMVRRRLRSFGFPIVNGGRVHADCAGEVATADLGRGSSLFEGLRLEAVQRQSHLDCPFIAGHPIEDVDTIVAYRV